MPGVSLLLLRRAGKPRSNRKKLFKAFGALYAIRKYFKFLKSSTLSSGWMKYRSKVVAPFLQKKPYIETGNLHSRFVVVENPVCETNHCLSESPVDFEILHHIHMRR